MEGLILNIEENTRKKFVEKLKIPNVETKRDSQTFYQIKRVLEKIQKLLEENNLNIYIARWDSTISFIR